MFKEVQHDASICGTGNIFASHLLADKIPEQIGRGSSRDEVIEALDEGFLGYILGSHRFARGYFEHRGTPLSEFPYRSVMRVLGTGENHSDYIGQSDELAQEIAYESRAGTGQWREVDQALVRRFCIPV